MEATGAIIFNLGKLEVAGISASGFVIVLDSSHEPRFLRSTYRLMTAAVSGFIGLVSRFSRETT